MALHKRIRSDLEEHILSGDWPPGHRIPYGHELMEQYGCARMTVNRAISTLVQAGLVERRRRAGTFVAQPAMESAILAIPNLPEEIKSQGKKYRYERRSREERLPTAADAKAFQVETGFPIIEVTSRHFADEIPFVSEIRIINIAAVPKAEHNISAITPNRQVARELEIPRSMACLCLERRTWRNGVRPSPSCTRPVAATFTTSPPALRRATEAGWKGLYPSTSQLEVFARSLRSLDCHPREGEDPTFQRRCDPAQQPDPVVTGFPSSRE
ncbi:GntR family transcriptional regulator [Breoghania sp.]|uniref:GntR family transcriptional regulator n=1 Tax=Breoghania sp. TaxID=2065378 RepID=UPI00261957E9|nr:GntR family transcriptional regulator [Breoghania sp.]MDJ0932868.1 GntR family transcriptional regulator [Breoghania sp.]